jgi:3-hydroxyacyl-[acyl-carrier-protein] dehydratase
MFKDTLYTLKKLQFDSQSGKAEAVILLHKDHDIFRGHFPGNPVLPGVCMVQIMKELISDILQKDVILTEANTIKFQNPVNPHENPELHVAISLGLSHDIADVRIQVSYHELNFCNLKGQFRVSS